MTTDPDEYPAVCTIDADELERLKHACLNDDLRGAARDEWPPRDDLGNPYPVWFTLDDLTDDGFLQDKHGATYSPWAGNLEPLWEGSTSACDAPLIKWRFRYPDIRYCSTRIDTRDNDHHCQSHQYLEAMKSAEEYVQTGLFTKTVDHLYENLTPWKQLFAWGTFESLLGESVYEFAPETQIEVIDFSEEAVVPDDVGADGQLEVEFSYPTDHVQPAQALYVAAVNQVTMMQVQSRVVEERIREDGTKEGAMEAQSVSKAQLTAPPNEHDPSPQEFKTITEWTEHHLNLPLSRLISDQPDLLEMGGVVTDPEASDDTMDDTDIVLELDADTDTTTTVTDQINGSAGTDPTAVGDDMTSQSDKIAQHASDDSES